MSIEAQVTEKQSFEVIIQGPDGASRMIICTGKLSFLFNAVDNTETTIGVVQKETFTALIDPQLEAGQFKRAIAVASLADIGGGGQVVRWAIEGAQADFDDESGKVELRVSVMLNPQGGLATINGISFQVTTIAAVQGQ